MMSRHKYGVLALVNSRRVTRGGPRQHHTHRLARTCQHTEDHIRVTLRGTLPRADHRPAVGRDLLSRLIFGARYSLFIGSMVVVLAMSVGVVLGLGIAADITATEWLWLLSAITLVWFAETMNTAFEYLCDVVQPEFHSSVGRAKDIAAGAVLITAIYAVAVGALVLLPALLG